MKVAFLSDVHANLPALRACLTAISAEGADRIVFAGDAVGTGPFPSETVDLLGQQKDLVAIRGNVDRRVLKLCGKKRKKLQKRLSDGPKKLRNRAWSALNLDDASREWLEALPETAELSVEGRKVLVVHGSPLGDSDYLYPSLTPEALARKLAPVSGPRPDLLVCGHSHVPFVLEVDGVVVLNCGSAGKPADGDPRGSFAVADIDEKGIQARIIRFEYPLDELGAALESREVPGVTIEDYREGLRA